MSRPVVQIDSLLNKRVRSTHFQPNHNLLKVSAKRRWRRKGSAGKKKINKKEQCFLCVSQALLAIEYGQYKMFGSLITIFLWTNKFHLTREWNSTKDLILAGWHAILAIIAKAPKRVQSSTGFEPVPQALIMWALLPSKLWSKTFVPKEILEDFFTWKVSPPMVITFYTVVSCKRT